jgi:hypothetical protein
MPALIETRGNRRQHERRIADLGCKILRRKLARYVAARTSDVSPGGALLEVITPVPLVHGEELELGVGWDDRGVLRQRDLIVARVVRVEPLHGNTQRIAIAFAKPQAAAASLAGAQAA